MKKLGFLVIGAIGAMLITQGIVLLSKPRTYTQEKQSSEQKTEESEQAPMTERTIRPVKRIIKKKNCSFVQSENFSAKFSHPNRHRKIKKHNRHAIGIKN